MRGTRTVLALLFLACLPAASSRAQALDDPRGLLDAYASIADRYRQGRAEAASELLALGPFRLKALNDLLARTVRQPATLSQTGERIWTPQ